MHEIERTYAPTDDVGLPDLTRLPGVVALDEPVEHVLLATYVDTADLTLSRAGVTLRRRSGGEDEGWHLKLPVAVGREEVHAPLGRSAAVPVRLRRLVHQRVRGAALGVVAELETRRTTRLLRDDTGAVLAEVADDRVSGRTPGGDPVAWREWEVELVGGDLELLEAADALMAEAGAPVSDVQRKLLRVLGEAVPSAPVLKEPRADKAVKRVVRSRLVDLVEELHRRDVEVRRDLPDGVHQARVTCRRLRSLLATYRPVLDREVTDPVRAEVRWLAGQLGAARDTEVVAARLRTLLAEEPVGLVAGPVRRGLDRYLRTQAKQGRATALEALDSPRYLALLDALDALVAAPPWTELAGAPAEQVLPDLLRRESKRFRARVAAIAGTEPGPDRDHAWHDARKAAKRLRYAAESAEPVLGKPARSIRKEARGTTRVLGEHQDTVLTRQHLVRLAAEAQAAGESGFTFGRLHAREEARAAVLEGRVQG